MHRQLLINLLRRHAPYDYTGVKCDCGEWFSCEDENGNDINPWESWARHVANAIYPE